MKRETGSDITGGMGIARLIAMPTDDTPAQQPEPACKKCGSATTLLSFIPRFGDRPAFLAFECGTCNALTWIAEAIRE
jgi:hypothetical protein